MKDCFRKLINGKMDFFTYQILPAINHHSIHLSIKKDQENNIKKEFEKLSKASYKDLVYLFHWKESHSQVVVEEYTGKNFFYSEDIIKFLKRIADFMEENFFFISCELFIIKCNIAFKKFTYEVKKIDHANYIESWFDYLEKESKIENKPQLNLFIAEEFYNEALSIYNEVSVNKNRDMIEKAISYIERGKTYKHIEGSNRLQTRLENLLLSN